MNNNKILNILKKKSNRGLSITDLVKLSGFSRSALRILLAKLEGAGLVSVRKVGMAKLYYLTKEDYNDN